MPHCGPFGGGTRAIPAQLCPALFTATEFVGAGTGEHQGTRSVVTINRRLGSRSCRAARRFRGRVLAGPRDRGYGGTIPQAAARPQAITFIRE